MPYNTMSHVGLEDDYATPEQLTKMAGSWHYAWTWSGPQPDDCSCTLQPCGLVVPDSECHLEHGRIVGRARQLHKAKECPGGP